jgi:hypothetical protein
MNRLWIMYDLGGISCGRAERAALLEAVTNLVRINWKNDSISTERLIEEAYKRPIVRFAIHPKSLTDLRSLCFEHFMWLALHRAGKWYKQDTIREVSPGCYVSIEEKNIFEAIERILNVEEGARELHRLGFKPTSKELIEEGRTRRIAGYIF